MGQIICIFTFVISLGISNIALGADCDKACQENLVNRYFSLVNEVYKKNSTKGDIGKLFSLFHADVKYQHVEYGANFNREEWRKAFEGNLQRGAYRSDKNSRIKVEKYIFGKTHIAVEYSYGVTDEDGSWAPEGDQKLLALVGIYEGKIISVTEYW